MFDLFETIKTLCPEAQCFDDGKCFRIHVSEHNVWRINQLLEHNIPVILVAKQEGTVGPGAIFPKALWAPKANSWWLAFWRFLRRPCNF